jgi:hypothetical protein
VVFEFPKAFSQTKWPKSHARLEVPSKREKAANRNRFVLRFAEPKLWGGAEL